jgi:tetratricopeptide (TPR) repeat protein
MIHRLLIDQRRRVSRRPWRAAGLPARAAATVGLAVVMALASAAPASADLGSDIRAAQTQARSLGSSTSFDRAGEEALVNRIDALCDSFHEQAAAGASLGSTAQMLLELLTANIARYSAVLEKIQADVIAADGDLEAAQDSPAWREREVLAMRLRYRVNWVRFEIAMRYERTTSKRATLLRQARDGFGEFLGSGDKALENESLFGRGLCAKALRDYGPAAEDLRAVLSGGADAQLAARARVALSEIEINAGNTGAALEQTSRLLSQAPASGEERMQATFLRAKALLMALGARGGSASAKAGYRSEAAKLLERLYNGGRYWQTKAVQLIDAGIEDPSSWTAGSTGPFVTWLVAGSLRRRGDCGAAVTLYRSLLAQNAYTTESHYGLGFCAFHNRDFANAMTELGIYLDAAAPDHSWRDQAAYLRFKASESLYFQADANAAGEAAAVYRGALQAFLVQAPDHENAFEAWFRLGELRRDEGDLVGCAEAFSKVHTDRGYELKAMFLGAQCRMQVVNATPEDAEPSAADVQAAVDAVDTFVAATDDEAESATVLAPMRAKAVVMGAALMGRGGVGDMNARLARLSGFSQRFPAATDLAAEVHALRIVAYRTLGDLDGAGRELEALLALDDMGTYGLDSLKKLGVVFLKEASERDLAEDTAGARRAREVALAIYERLLSEARVGRLDEPIDGIQSLVEDLRRQSE